MDRSKVLSLFQNRYSCREFSDQKISQKDFEIILESGRLAPSVLGIEPWKFLVIADDGVLKQHIQSASPLGMTQIYTCSHLVCFLSATAQTLVHSNEYLQKKFSNIQQLDEQTVKKTLGLWKVYYEKLADLSDDRLIFEFSCKQAYLPLANMLTMATGMGIASCAIEGFDKAKVDALLAQYCNIDLSTYRVSHMATFGYAKHIDSVPEKKRQDFDSIVSWY